MQRSSPNSSPVKPPSSSVYHAPPINPTHPPNTEDYSPPPPNYNSHLSSNNNLSLQHSQLPPLSSPHIFIILLFLMTLIVITPLLIPPFILSGNLLKFTLLLHHQLKLMTFR